MANLKFSGLLMIAIALGCEAKPEEFVDNSRRDGGSDSDADSDSDTDADTDADTDGDMDADADTDSDSDTEVDTDTSSEEGSDDGTDNDTTFCIDNDTDDWCEEFDCNDDNPNQNQDQTEVEGNGIDDDCDGLTDELPDFGPNGDGTIQGIVKSATGFPISGALVYLTEGNAPEIPDNPFCYECDDVIKGMWTLSASDGTWSINMLPPMTVNIVTRKGFFQRQREITIDGTPGVQNIPEEITTLPGENSTDGLDHIPNYAVLMNYADRPEDMLAKMGMGDLRPNGHLLQGSQNFDLYNDGESSNSAVGDSSTLLGSLDNLNQYHMIFFPCLGDTLAASNYVSTLREYVEGGGKIYSSCWASQWAEQPFPDVIEFEGNDNIKHAGNVGLYDTYGSIQDSDMKDWLAVVAPSEDPNRFPFVGAWIQIDSISSTAYNGHGVEVNPDGSVIFGQGPVIPEIWVVDMDDTPPGGEAGGITGKPLTLTYNYDCGEIFYSTYQVVESEPSPDIRAQEWVLIYLFYEIGVCEGEYNDGVV